MQDIPSVSAPRIDIPALLNGYRQLRETEPGLRARDVAQRLGVSEGALVASRVGDGVTRLAGDSPAIIRDLPSLGHVMALTRNAYCVHEKKGVYDHIDIGGTMGIVLAEDIDLRLFLRHWRYGFAVKEHSRGRDLESLQFFDGDGTAVHKVYLTEVSDRSAWRTLLQRYTAPVQSPLIDIGAVEEPLPKRLADAAVDTASLRDYWRALRDPHDFFAMLKKHKVTRTQALRLVGDEFATPVANEAVRTVLEGASTTGIPLMVFVGSPGVVQIHTGPVANIVMAGPWINVMDPSFNLHLRMDAIASSWIVRKPVPEGVVTSLELYAADGTQIVQVFGKRKPGVPERDDWRALLDTVEVSA
ncbi:hemin-degrading factor [Luteibacter sp. UNCMF366Tsu5.1]|uniref:hemin-degrading factor n=1 Tax=Luteibacter sp. UNCMF366Tsu5.1 TaxID=1502758 RepID=UPI000908801C|nr:ChuX/HutX family heme-like substrate-binding protein [Luteibacter sp. UNCMF366Tsu5.1]SFW52453.1 putative hemin transport protein [Luteibacter sp. UNCMF366Tsu5.1]